MKPEFLDLNHHDPEAIPGKLIRLAGATYLLGELVGEGGECFVYPMRNVQTGISWFAAKIYKFRPGSAEYEERRKDVGFSSFIFDLEGVSVFYTEIHEIPGGLMRLQRLLSTLEEPAYHRELMKNGTTLASEQRWAEADAVYRRVLEVNPDHPPAMLNLSTCLLNQGNFPDALRLLDRAMKMEPNDTEIYRQMAKVFANLKLPLQAIQVLDITLRRYRWDAANWKVKAKIAHDFALDAVLKKMREELQPLEVSGNADLIRQFIAELEQQIKEATQRRAMIQATGAIQEKEGWSAALQGWERVGLANLDAFNQLNAIICKFHLRRFSEVAHEACSSMGRLHGPSQAAAALLALITTIKTGAYGTAQRMASVLCAQFSHPMDLPGVPTMICGYGEAVMESRSPQEIIEAITVLSGQSRDGEMARAVTKLKEMYQQRKM